MILVLLPSPLRPPLSAAAAPRLPSPPRLCSPSHRSSHPETAAQVNGFSPFTSFLYRLPSPPWKKRSGGRVRRATLADDAPFAAAMGACILNSLVSPLPSDEGSGGALDTRMAVMGIVSFIPFFNWLSWVFAWMDSGKQRYLVYAVVYLAPYLRCGNGCNNGQPPNQESGLSKLFQAIRTNLSLSPEESWLPIASLVLCVIHVQLEASMRNGDLDDIKVLKEIQNLFISLPNRKVGISYKMRPPPAHGDKKMHHDSRIPGKQVDEAHFDEPMDMKADDAESD